ncbi:MAG: hypothetical protein LBE04_00350, partial [Prevotellaceae bacterium]|nr:hypothetical protein [Prevotellaceae bacterium]
MFKNSNHTIAIFLIVTCLLFSFTEDKDRYVTVFEKVYLHFDRHFYLSGDDIWFKAYLVDAQTNKLSQKSSRILYAELISPESKILMRRVLYVDSDGCSIGDFKLKKTAVSGKYRIRAYTKWMLNFGDVFVFEKEIEVQNIPDKQDSKKKRKEKNDKSNKTVITRENVEIEFFPESGSLIAGIENIVAFKANDWSGKGVDVSGGVFNANGDTVALFSSEYLGMGKFVFSPQAGESYNAFFVTKNVPYSLFEKLPETLNRGFTINVTDDDSVFILNIRTNPESFTDFSGKKILLVFRQSGKPLFGHEMIIDDFSIFLSLNKSLLPAGITRITLYGEDEKPYCERLVYIENREKINVSITPAGDTVSKIKITDDNGNPLQANLSMSITDSIVPDEMFNIESYMWLESEVKGKIERASAYFNTTNAERFKQIDLLLLTQGWRDFVWKQVENDTAMFAGYETEKGLKISGHVKKSIGKKPYPNANISMYFPHFGTEGAKLTQTDSLGNYDFGYMNFLGYKLIYLNSKTKKGKKTGVISINPLSMSAEEFPLKVWEQYQTDSIYTFFEENYKRKDYKLTDTIVLDPVTVTNKNYRQHLMSDREITPKDRLWKSLDFYLKGKAPGLMTARLSSDECTDIKITFLDLEGKKLKTIPPHISKISMKEVDRVIIYREDAFCHFDGKVLDKAIYTIVVYSIHNGFTSQNYPSSQFTQDWSEGAAVSTVINEDGYYEENIVPHAGYNSALPIGTGDSKAFYITTVGNVDYSSISPIVGGFYEERKFYAPKFDSNIDAKDYFGTYFWQADIRTDINGECTVNYNPQKQPSGKIRIEGFTNKEMPFAV